jgi:hypothetical protein
MKIKLYRRAFILGILFAFSSSTSCKQEGAASENPTVEKISAPVSTPQKTQKAKKSVAKVVFVGQQNACDCTRKRVDDSFAALKGALGGRQDIPIEQIQVDVDEAKVTQYQEMRAIMVLPAIYLLDESGELIDVLQGAVTVQQLDQLLK